MGTKYSKGRIKMQILYLPCTLTQPIHVCAQCIMYFFLIVVRFNLYVYLYVAAAFIRDHQYKNNILKNTKYYAKSSNVFVVVVDVVCLFARFNKEMTKARTQRLEHNT